MTAYVFGNPDLPVDSLPLKLLPELKKRLPEWIFEVKDPNEEWETPRCLVVIDTVLGITGVRVFQGLTSFARTPRVSMHDFDALMQLRLLEKLGKIDHVTVIGLSPDLKITEALDAVELELRRLM